MSKKSKSRARPHGWPHAHKGSQRESTMDALRRLTDRLRKDTVPGEEFERYSARLSQILYTWHEFRLLRPDMADLREALKALPDAERDAFGNPEMGERRSHRAKAKVFAHIFDLEILDDLLVALGRAAERAGSPDDLGALALGFHSITGHSDGSVSPDTNVLMAQLLGIAFEEYHELDRVLRQIAASLDEAAAGAPVDPAQRKAKLDEALATNPTTRRYLEMRAHRQVRRFVSYIEHGLVRAHLTADELAPVVAEIRRVGPTSDASADPDPVEESLRAFAADPANTPIFERVAQELDAQAKEAAAAGHPSAQRLAVVAAVLMSSPEQLVPARILACQASLARLQREGKLPPAADRPSTEAP